MTYFDTDVLVNAAVKQEPTKYLQANKIIEQTILSGKFQISWLSIQELGFVLAKLKEPKEVINESLGQLMASVTSQLQQDNLHQSHRISPSNFNDCLHIAIAEEYCTELYTYNSRDFGRIQPLTSLTIHIL